VYGLWIKGYKSILANMEAINTNRTKALVIGRAAMRARVVALQITQVHAPRTTAFPVPIWAVRARTADNVFVLLCESKTKLDACKCSFAEECSFSAVCPAIWFNSPSLPENVIDYIYSISSRF
jgi:hypothetical protein